MPTVIEVNWDAIEPERSRMRVLAARVEVALDGLREEQGDRVQALSRLVAAWADIVGELALGVEPSLRTCPHCNRSILEVAVRCRYCMERSPAVEPGSVAKR
jgi:hypothetical protein